MYCDRCGKKANQKVCRECEANYQTWERDLEDVIAFAKSKSNAPGYVQGLLESTSEIVSQAA